ncbi:PREDICTED: testis-expressed sequence 43 protein, partial [Nipponia nippon]|uniref:testis-expressed sequence 43 protein n=1 Tax=Nipponia nippon TaxID=128390 RepID=UPI0005109FFE
TTDEFALTASNHWNVFIHHAELAEIYTEALEDSLFLEHEERLCHEDERKIADILMHSYVSRYWVTVIAHACRKLMTSSFLLQTSWNSIND